MSTFARLGPVLRWAKRRLRLLLKHLPVTAVLSLIVSAVVAYAQFHKVTRGELSVVSWDKPVADDKGQLLTKVSVVVSNTGDHQFMLLSAGSRALLPNAKPGEAKERTWDGLNQPRAERPDGVIIEPGKMNAITVYVPTTLSLRKLKFNSELSSTLHDQDCGDETHYTVVVTALIVGIDGKYRGAHSPKMCFYVDREGQIAKVRRFTSGGAPFDVLPYESFTF